MLEVEQIKLWICRIVFQVREQKWSEIPKLAASHKDFIKKEEKSELKKAKGVSTLKSLLVFNPPLELIYLIELCSKGKKATSLKYEQPASLCFAPSYHLSCPLIIWL